MANKKHFHGLFVTYIRIHMIYMLYVYTLHIYMCIHIYVYYICIYMHIYIHLKQWFLKNVEVDKNEESIYEVL